MIVLKLQGGLGNQLFQYQAYERISEKFPDVYLDITQYNLPFNDQFRKYGLDNFTTIPIKFCMFSDSHKKKIYYHFFSNSIKIFPLKIYNKLQIIDLSDESISTELNEVCDNSYIIGWFANIRFMTIYNKKFFFFKSQIMNNVDIKILLNEIEKVPSVAVHVRRTDYIEGADVYGNICTDEYYNSSINYMKKNILNPVFFIFSDDIKWCKKTFGHSNSFRYISNEVIHYKNSTIEDLFLMSSCKHNIIANSTYSFWGAVLNKNTEKIIIRPHRWNNVNDGKNIYPENWIIM